MSYDFLSKSDAVIFTLSVDSPVSETERDYLLRAGESAAEFFFAVNKTDTVSKESLSEYLAYCRSVLSEIMEKPVQLFPVSAKTEEGIEELKKAVLSALEASQDRILEQSAEAKFLFLKRQISSLLLLRRKTALLSREELREKTVYVKAGIEKVHALSDEAQVLAKRDAKLLIEKIADYFQPELQNIYEREKRFLAGQKEELAGGSLKEFESQLSSRGEAYAKELLEALNQKGLDLLNEGYAQICSKLEIRSCSIAEDLSNLLKESFGVEYASARKEFTVSERSDFHIAFSKSTAYLFDLNDFVRFLPKKKAMEVISRKTSDALVEKIERNANNMVYNYRYKMQESLRELCSAYGKYTREMEEEYERILELAEGDSLSAEKGCEETVCRCDSLIRLTNEI